MGWIVVKMDTGGSFDSGGKYVSSGGDTGAKPAPAVSKSGKQKHPRVLAGGGPYSPGSCACLQVPGVPTSVRL